MNENESDLVPVSRAPHAFSHFLKCYRLVTIVEAVICLDLVIFTLNTHIDTHRYMNFLKNTFILQLLLLVSGRPLWKQDTL